MVNQGRGIAYGFTVTFECGNALCPNRGDCAPRRLIHVAEAVLNGFVGEQIAGELCRDVHCPVFRKVPERYMTN